LFNNDFLPAHLLGAHALLLQELNQKLSQFKMSSVRLSVGQADSGVNCAGNNINQNTEYNIQKQPITASSKT